MAKRLGVAALALSLPIATVMVVAPFASAAKLPGTSCRLFPSDNVGNTRVNKLPVHSMSATWLAAMGSSAVNLHPDYGPAGGARSRTAYRGRSCRRRTRSSACSSSTRRRVTRARTR